MNTDLNSTASYLPVSKLSNSNNCNSQTLALMKPSNQSDLPTQEQKKSIAQIYLEQAKVYYQEDNWHKAILACKNALETAPNTADAYRILGDILYRQGKQAEALGIYAKALTIDPNLATVYANVGALYVDRGDWKQALDYYQQAVILDPNLAEGYRNLAQAWEELGDSEKALECFCRAIDIDSTILQPEEYFSFGKDLYKQGKVKEASILFIHGVESDPSAEAELSQLVQILEELEEWQKAVVYYHRLISSPDGKNDRETRQNGITSSSEQKPIRKLLSNAESSPSKVIAKNTRSNISVLPKNVAHKLLPKVKSETAVNNSLVDISTPNTTSSSEKELDSAFSWNNLGSAYAQKRQWEKAISCYQEALQLNPSFAKSYRNLARIYNNRGEELKAALYWYESFSLEPDSVKPEEYFALATRLIKYQQAEKAIACLRRAVELKPDFSQAKMALDKLLHS